LWDQSNGKEQSHHIITLYIKHGFSTALFWFHTCTIVLEECHRSGGLLSRIMHEVRSAKTTQRLHETLTYLGSKFLNANLFCWYLISLFFQFFCSIIVDTFLFWNTLFYWYALSFWYIIRTYIRILFDFSEVLRCFFFLLSSVVRRGWDIYGEYKLDLIFLPNQSKLCALCCITLADASYVHPKLS
jgi:hypothetical protein